MRRRAFFVLVLGATLIGLVPIGVRLCTLHPLAVGFWRFALALPVLWWWSRSLPKRSAPASRRRLLIIAGLLFACDIGCYFVAIRATSVANATLLSNCAPIFVALGVAATASGLPSRVALLATASGLPSRLALLATAIALGGPLRDRAQHRWQPPWPSAARGRRRARLRRLGLRHHRLDPA